MPKPLDEIRAAIPFGRSRRVWNESSRVEEHRIPRAHQRAYTERKWHDVLRRRVTHWPQRSYVGVERGHIGVGELRVGSVWKRGIKALSVRSDTLAQRARKLCLRPRADFRAGIRRYVR